MTDSALLSHDAWRQSRRLGDMPITFQFGRTCTNIQTAATFKELDPESDRLHSRPTTLATDFSYRMLVLLVLMMCAAHIVGGQRVESSDCSAFSTDGLAASQFQYYRFYDFRNLSTSSPERRPRRRDSDVTNRTVSDGSWTDDWYIRDFPRASPGGQSIAVNFIPERVEIVNSTDDSEYYSTYLTLSTARIDDEDQESGEITFTEFNITAASIRVLGRIHGAPGAVAGIFTYQNDTQESDIELFTRAPDTYVQYSNQPASSGEPDWTPISGATVNNTIPQDFTYSDWLVHRLDWVPGRSVFFVNNEQTNTTDLHVPVSDPPSAVYLDMWSANSTWSGSMEIGKNASFDIQWVELVFNTTDDLVEDRSTDNVCEVGVIDAEAAEESGAGSLVSGPVVVIAGLLGVLVHLL